MRAAASAALAVALCAAVGAAQEQGAGQGPGAGPRPESLDLVQSRLARYRETVETLRAVAEGLDGAAEFEAAAVLLTDEGDAAQRLREALRIAREAKRRPAATVGGAVHRAAEPAVETVPETAEAAEAGPAERPAAPALRLGSADVLYAQLAEPARGLGAKVVLRVRTRRYVLAAGSSAVDGADTVSLEGVTAAEGAGGGLLVALSVNGRRTLLPYGGGR